MDREKERMVSQGPVIRKSCYVGRGGKYDIPYVPTYVMVPRGKMNLGKWIMGLLRNIKNRLMSVYEGKNVGSRPRAELRRTYALDSRDSTGGPSDIDKRRMDLQSHIFCEMLRQHSVSFNEMLVEDQYTGHLELLEEYKGSKFNMGKTDEVDNIIDFLVHKEVNQMVFE